MDLRWLNPDLTIYDLGNGNKNGSALLDGFGRVMYMFVKYNFFKSVLASKSKDNTLISWFKLYMIARNSIENVGAIINLVCGYRF